MATFEEQIKAFAEKTEKRAELVVRKILFDLYAKIDERSPVGDAKYWKSPAPTGYVGGRFRANWQYAFSSQPSEELNTTAYSATAEQIKTQIGTGQMLGTHYLVNNVPYAGRIENGWSRQAPTGVVKVTAEEFQHVVKAAAKAIL